MLVFSALLSSLLRAYNIIRNRNDIFSSFLATPTPFQNNYKSVRSLTLIGVVKMYIILSFLFFISKIRKTIGESNEKIHHTNWQIPSRHSYPPLKSFSILLQSFRVKMHPLSVLEKSCIWTTLFKLHNNPQRLIFLWLQLHRWGNQSIKKLRNLSKANH